jgi:hypothetical protein
MAVATVPPKRTFSRPVYMANLDIRTAYAQEIVERSFADTAKAIFYVSVIMRAIGGKEEVDAVEGQVKDKLKVCKEELEKDIDRVRLIIDQSQVGVTNLEYTAPLAITLRIDSPRLSRYLGTIKKLDELCQAIDSAWMFELISDEQRANWLHEARRSVRSASGVILSLYTRSEKLARAKKFSVDTITSAGAGEGLTNVVSLSDQDAANLDASPATATLETQSGEIASVASVAPTKKRSAKVAA